MIIKATERNANKTVSKAVEEGLQEILSRVPVDDGDLKSTCIKRDDGQGNAMLMAGGPSQISDKFVDYELDVEFGTENQAAQSFFRPAVEMAKRIIKNDTKVTDK